MSELDAAIVGVVDRLREKYQGAKGPVVLSWHDCGLVLDSLDVLRSENERLTNLANARQDTIDANAEQARARLKASENVRQERETDLTAKLKEKEAVLSMAVARLGGNVEGRPTQRINFLQRIDELRKIERDVAEERADADASNERANAAEAREESLAGKLAKIKCPERPGDHLFDGDGQCKQCGKYATDMVNAALAESEPDHSPKEVMPNAPGVYDEHAGLDAVTGAAHPNNAERDQPQTGEPMPKQGWGPGLWLNYPLSKAVAYLESLRADGYRSVIMAHVLQIGPFAIALCWNTRKGAET